jgi:hypothetical protein
MPLDDVAPPAFQTEIFRRCGAASRRSIALCSWGGDLPLPKSDKEAILISNR